MVYMNSIRMSRRFSSWFAVCLVALVLRQSHGQIVVDGKCGTFNDYESVQDQFFEDGGLNTVEFLARYVGVNVTDPIIDFGEVCSPDALILSPLTPSEDETIDRCRQVETDTEVQRPTGADRYLVSRRISNPPSEAYVLAFRIVGYIPNGNFSHLRFWYAESPESAMQGFMVALLSDGGSGFSIVYTFTLNSTTCAETGAWNSYDLPLEQVDAFLDSQSGTASFVGLQVFFQEVIADVGTLGSGDDGNRSHAIDNLELINLNSTGDRIDPAGGINRLDAFGLLQNVECVQLSELLEVDIFALSSFGLIGGCLACFFIAAAMHSIFPSLGHAVDVLWFVVSFSLAILAVVELEDFTRQLSELDSCTNVANEAFRNATELINPIELKNLFDFGSSSAFGTFRIALPPYSLGTLQDLFFADTSCTSAADANSQLFQDLCSGSNPELTCTTDQDFFLSEEIATNVSITSGNGLPGLTGVYSLYGEVVVTQDHFIPFVIAAFAVDIALSIVHVILRLLFRVLITREHWRAKLILYCNVLSVMISAGFTAYILSVALLEPLRYEGQFVLRRDIGRSTGGTYDLSLGTFICPKLVTTERSKLQLDISGVQSIANSFSDLTNLQQNLLEQQLATLREISPTGIDTVNSLCPLDSATIDIDANGNTTYRIDCVPDVKVSLLPEQGAEERLSFVIFNVIIGLVLVDFLITFTDVVSLALMFRVLSKAGIVDVAFSARSLIKSST